MLLIVSRNAARSYMCSICLREMPVQILIHYACSADAKSAPAWLQLTSLRCPRNSIPAMDASLATLPAMRSCDLSGNDISIVQV